MSNVVEPAVSYDQPTVGAVVVTYAGSVIEINGIESLQTQKAEGADAGTFSLTCPDLQNAAAAQAISPNDIIAIYGCRASSDGSDYDDLGPSASVVALQGTAWGNPTTIRGLQSQTCMFIGMIDRVAERGTPGGSVSLSISGRDLTKIFLEYDCGYYNTPTRQVYFPKNPPAGVTSSQQKAVFAAENLASILIALANFAITQEKSGTSLLNDILDTAMARDFNVGQIATAKGGITSAISAQDQAIIAEFGFPWRNFVLTDKLDPTFRHYNGVATTGLTFQIQPGSMWANLQELKNEPFNRLFVTEDGFLIFDDTLTAYTQDEPRYTIEPSDIRDFETELSDETVATFVTVLGAYELNKGLIATLQSTFPQLGNIGGAGYAAFADATGEAVSAGGDGTVQRYGLRSKTLISNYDQGFNQSAMARLFQFIVGMLNNQLSATLTVRGRATYRVGDRIIVNYGHLLPATNGATWYVSQVTQSYDFGSEWTTTLRLLYPSTGAFLAF